MDAILALIHRWNLPQFLYNWQTLIAGGLAVGAAVGTIWATIWSANREIAASRAQTAVARQQNETTIQLAQARDDREAEAIKASLAVEFRAFLKVLVQAHEALVKVERLPNIAARNLKFATALPDPVVYRATADRIGLLGALAPLVTAFYIALDRINVSVNVVADNPTGMLGDGDVRRIANLFEQACRTSLYLLSQLPLDEGDTELRAKIEGMMRF